MKVALRCAAAICLLLASLPAWAKYFDEKDVKSSPWYSGTPGSARISPISASAWLQLNPGEATIGYHGFIIEDPQLTALVYEISNRLLQSWPGSVPQMVIYVQGEASPTKYGAATTDAREIFLFYGVLVNADSEDELAAVIAHELGHILLDHVKTLNYRKKMRGSVEVLGQARDLYATAEAMHYDERSKELQVDPEVSKGLKQSANQQLLANELYDSAHASLFSRGNEFEADRFAIDLLLASGYSAMGLKTSLERLAHSYDLGSQISEQLTDNSKQLMDKYTTQFNQGVAQPKQGQTDYSGTLNKLQKDLGDSALEIGKSSMLGWASRSHPVTDKRIEHFSSYLQDNYSRKERRKRQNPASAQRFNSGAIGQLVTNYVAANEAMVALKLGNEGEAKRLAGIATSAPTTKQAYPRYVAFSLKSNSGTVTLADVNAVEQYGLVPIHASLLMVNALATAGKLDQALATATNTESRFGNIAAFYPVKIQAATAAGDQARAQQLANDCFSAKDGTKALANTCAQLAGIEKPNAAEKSMGAVGNFGKSIMGGAKGLFGKGK